MLRRRLVHRIVQARGKTRLQQLLKETKDRAGGKAKFNVTGTSEELEQAVDDAITGGFLSESEVLRLTDDLEEIGGQHVFLYKLSRAGKEQITPAVLRAAFKKHVPSADYYGEKPTGNAVEWLERDGVLYLKQVHTASYWELDRKQSVWNDEVRKRIWQRVDRRAVNLFWVDFKTATVDVCVDRLRGENDEKLAERELSAFLAALAPTIKAKEHLIPVRISHAFGDIVSTTLGETFLNADGVYDEDVAHHMSNRRKGTRGLDIRKNPGYNLGQEDYDRDGLSIYWYTAPASHTYPAKKVHGGDDSESEGDAG